MNYLTIVRLLALLTLLVSLAGIPLYGQGQEPASQDPAAQSQPSESQSSMSQQSNENQAPQIFVGKIAKSNGTLELKDDAGTSYKLDKSDQAQQFVGKNVTITGTLDKSTNTIHITNIEAPSS